MSTAVSETPAVSTFDRLSFTFFLAAAIHGLLIFGVSFELGDPYESAPSVTVTLATHQSLEEPEEADFIAEANQIGSGTLDESKQITTDQLSPFDSQSIEKTELINQTPKPVEQQLNPNLISTTGASPNKVAVNAEDKKQQKQEQGEDAKDVKLLTQEIASLSAKLDKQRQEYAKRPRERVLTSVSTKASRDAAYLNAWTRKVESVGNENFPREAVQQKITGSLRLQTVVKWDGSLIKAEILQSSGHSVLDAAALQIIQQSAPFLPFPPDIRSDTDQLVIIRTWHFEIDGLSTSN